MYRNTLFFLYPLESERPWFANILKRKIAYEYIEQDKTINLSEDQKKEVKKELKKADEGLKDAVRRLYRVVIIPGKDSFPELDLGIPTYGEQKCIDEEVYEKFNLLYVAAIHELPLQIVCRNWFINFLDSPFEKIFLPKLSEYFWEDTKQICVHLLLALAICTEAMMPQGLLLPNC